MKSEVVAAVTVTVVVYDVPLRPFILDHKCEEPKLKCVQVDKFCDVNSYIFIASKSNTHVSEIGLYDSYNVMEFT